VGEPRKLGFFKLLDRDTRVVLVVCDNVHAELDPVLEGLRQKGAPRTVVAVRWPTQTVVREGVDALVRSVAEAALRVWPHWDAGDMRTSTPRGTAARGNARRVKVLPSWRRRAEERVLRRELPLVPNIETTTQLEQLALALGPDELVLVVASDAGTDLASYVAAIRWAASQPAVRVVALVPRSVGESPDLVPIAAEKVHLDTVHTLDGGETHVIGVWTITEDGESVSQGELSLRHHLKRDPELGHLFSFNQKVSTHFKNRFQVDALWPEGKVCVEVDGYHFHSKLNQFCRDRQRDFEMMVDGYLVLRIPHDEVLDDPQKALEKVRAIVRFRNDGEKSR